MHTEKEEKTLPDFHRRNPFARFCCDETFHEKLQREYTQEDLIDIRVESKTAERKIKNKYAVASIEKAIGQYSDKKVTSQTLSGDWLIGSVKCLNLFTLRVRDISLLKKLLKMT